jgi:hypothetical protein
VLNNRNVIGRLNIDRLLWIIGYGGDQMTTPVLEQIEADIEHLSLAEQLWLMERLVHRIRTRTLRTPPVQESDLVAMAHDPAIQRELAQMNAEFAATEADGLDRAP